MIRFDSVNKQYSSQSTGLTDVSFQIDDNDFVFLTGPSGAGKTTILKLIMRQFLPTSGSIFIDEQDISAKNYHDTVDLRRRIGVVFQDFKILIDKNVFENIAIGLKITGMSTSNIRSQIAEVLALVSLDHKEKAFPLQLSAGELQRVAIARAIVGDRHIILADEPTGNLDPKTSWEIMKLFKKLEGEKTIIIATHNVDIVNSFKKRVLTMQNGKLLRDKRQGGYEL